MPISEEELQKLRDYIKTLELENLARKHDRASCSRELTRLRAERDHWFDEWYALHLEIEALKKGEK